jgi:hypothetical protein
VAAIPLLHLAVAVVIAAVGGMTGSTAGYVLLGAVAADLVAVFLAYRDARSLKTAGNLRGTGIAWWALLAPWAYLWARAVKRYGRTNLDWILLAASAALWFLVFVISAPIVSSVANATTTFNQAKVQADIARGIQNQLGVHAVVRCPKDPPVHPGATFQCLARLGRQPGPGHGHHPGPQRRLHLAHQLAAGPGDLPGRRFRSHSSYS